MLRAMPCRRGYSFFLIASADLEYWLGTDASIDAAPCGCFFQHDSLILSFKRRLSMKTAGTIMMALVPKTHQTRTSDCMAVFFPEIIVLVPVMKIPPHIKLTWNRI